MRIGWVVPAVIVSKKSAVSVLWVPTMKIVDRPSWVNVKRRTALRLRSALAGMSILRSTSPGNIMFWWSPITKSAAPTARSEPSVAHSVYVASNATVIVIIGPAGSDMQMLPPTVAEFHTLNEARKASQHVASRAPQSQLLGGGKEYRSPIVHIA